MRRAFARARPDSCSAPRSATSCSITRGRRHRSWTSSSTPGNCKGWAAPVRSCCTCGWPDSSSGLISSMRMRLAFSFIFAASGAAALVYEVTWTRLLTLQLGHGVAAASTVLAAFMGGLAAGSAIGGRVGPRLAPRQALRVYAALELGIGVLALILPFELRALDPLFSWAYADGNAGTSFAFLRLGASLFLLALPAAAMGATFPIASRWFVQHASH